MDKNNNISTIKLKASLLFFRFLNLTKTNFLYTIICSMFICGCGLGPKWQPHMTIEAPPQKPGAKEIIVSSFLYSEHQVSATGSAYISQILESAKITDISYKVASELSNKGFSTAPKKESAVKNLTPDQVLLKGALIIAPLKLVGSDIFHLLFSVTSIGCILPSPIGVHTGAEVYYRYELIDHQGNIIMQTGDKHSKVTFRHLWTWGYFRTDSDFQKISELAFKKMIDGLSEALK